MALDPSPRPQATLALGIPAPPPQCGSRKAERRLYSHHRRKDSRERARAQGHGLRVCGAGSGFPKLLGTEG